MRALNWRLGGGRTACYLEWTLWPKLPAWDKPRNGSTRVVISGTRPEPDPKDVRPDPTWLDPTKTRVTRTARTIQKSIMSTCMEVRYSIHDPLILVSYLIPRTSTKSPSGSTGVPHTHDRSVNCFRFGWGVPVGTKETLRDDKIWLASDSRSISGMSLASSSSGRFCVVFPMELGQEEIQESSLLSSSKSSITERYWWWRVATCDTWDPRGERNITRELWHLKN